MNQRLARSRALRGRQAAFALGAVCIALLGGCTPPAKVVTKITSARDQMKFLYAQGEEQGVIKCQVAPDGALSQCRNMGVQVEE